METRKKQPTLYLKPQGARSLAKGHLWIFSGAVTKVGGVPRAGDVVALADGANKFLGRAWYSPDSRIRARVLSLDQAQEFPEGWWLARLESARGLRSHLERDESTDGYRLVAAEADGLPGLSVDLFGKTAVVRALTPGADRLKQELARFLGEELGMISVLEKGDQVLRRFEGLPGVKGVLQGREPAGPVGFRENGLRYETDPLADHSGWYSDQRRNRALVASLAGEGRMLDCCSGSGAFAVAALAAGAKSAALIDSSSKALMRAKQNLELNGLADRADLVQGNLFNVMRQYIETGRLFETIVLDPDPRAQTKAQAPKGAQAYKDSNLLAMKLLAPGGVLATFSRTFAVTEEVFREGLFWAARDAGRELQILARLGQPEDYPILLGHPETESLRGYLCRAL